jgi:hypothetical protein
MSLHTKSEVFGFVAILRPINTYANVELTRLESTH